MRLRADTSVSRRGAIALAILGTCLGLSTHARASAELDRKYSLETIGTLRAWDNVDGIFAEYVQQSFRDFFQEQSRFVHQDLSRAEEVLERSKIAYGDLIQDDQVLARVAKSMRVESLIRTKVYKEGPSYRFSLDWLWVPRLPGGKTEVLGSESFVLSDAAALAGGTAQLPVSELKTALARSTDALIKRVPILGHVTGRDRDQLTINIGRSSQLQVGDTIVFGSLEEVKFHPLLKQIVDWRLAETGRGEIEDLDDGIGFVKVRQESPNRRIERYQKILRVIPRPVVDPSVATADATRAEQTQSATETSAKPTIGYIQGGLWLGSLSRTATGASGSGLDLRGSGLLLGAQGQAHLHLTPSVFTELLLGVGSAGYSQRSAITSAQTGEDRFSISVSRLQIAAGYKYFLSPSLLGPQAWAKLGYRRFGYGMPTSTNALSGTFSVGSLYVGVGGSLPIRGPYGVDLNIDFGLLPRASSNELVLGATDGSRDVSFTIGAFYRFRPRLQARLSLELVSQGADFVGGASISQRWITIQPAIQFFF